MGIFSDAVIKDNVRLTREDVAVIKLEIQSVKEMLKNTNKMLRELKDKKEKK